MSEKGRKKVIALMEANPQKELITELEGSQEQRFATQKFLKLLSRDKRCTDNGFCFWVISRAFRETGSNFPMILTQASKRIASNYRKMAQEKEHQEQAAASITASAEYVQNAQEGIDDNEH